MKLSEIPAGKLFRDRYREYRKVLLDSTIGSRVTGNFAIRWPNGVRVTWYSMYDPEVVPLNDDGTDVVEMVAFGALNPGEKFKDKGKVWIKSDTYGYGISGNRVGKFLDHLTYERVR